MLGFCCCCHLFWFWFSLFLSSLVISAYSNKTLQTVWHVNNRTLFLILKWSIKADSLSGKGMPFELQKEHPGYVTWWKASLGIFFIQSLNPVHSQELCSLLPNNHDTKGVDFNIHVGVGTIVFKLWYIGKGNLNPELLHLPI